jgi:hypothetical protein
MSHHARSLCFWRELFNPEASADIACMHCWAGCRPTKVGRHVFNLLSTRASGCALIIIVLTS